MTLTLNWETRDKEELMERGMNGQRENCGKTEINR